LLDPGIYFLFGNEDEIGKPTVYIGEAENLLTRIKQHNAGKDFWNSAICFVSEKKNINKAHIKYLENYCVEQAQKINKCKLENNVTPTQSSLTEQDTDFVLSFYDDLKILIATLGFPIFEESKKEKQNIFICKGKDAYAEGEYSEDGMTVFSGAKANLEETTTIGVWATNIRNSLVEQKVMKADGNVYIFQEDYTFNSPSAAAAVLLGRSANGWTEWKDKNGETLDKKFRQK
jgi:predicted GIY-YIG superfamily endonuclease